MATALEILVAFENALHHGAPALARHLLFWHSISQIFGPSAGFFSGNVCAILPSVLRGNQVGHTLSDMPVGNPCGTLFDSLAFYLAFTLANQPDMVASNIRAFVLTFFLAYILAFFLTVPGVLYGLYFGIVIIWQHSDVFWHSIWHKFRHSFWHYMCLYPGILSRIYSSIHSDILFGMNRFLAFYLAYILAIYLAFFPRFCLACVRASSLFFLAFNLEFYLISAGMFLARAGHSF